MHVDNLKQQEQLRRQMQRLVELGLPREVIGRVTGKAPEAVARILRGEWRG